MAGQDVEKLIVGLSADIKSFENAMARAAGVTRKQLKAVQAGATDFENATVLPFKKAADNLDNFGRSATNVGKNMGSFRSQVQQASFQVGDFATQVAGGTSATTALAQQLPQLLGAFGALGAVAGAVVAIGVPLASAFIKAGDTATSLADTTKELAEASNRLRDANAAALQSEEELTKAFGSRAGEMRKIIDLQAESAQIDFTAKIKANLQALADAFGELGNTSDRFDALFGGSDFTTFGLIARQAAEALSATDEQAQAVTDALYRLQDAEGIDAQAAAARDLAQAMATAAGGAGNLTGEAGELYKQLLNTARAGIDAASGIDAVTAAASSGAAASAKAAVIYGQLANAISLANSQQKARLDAATGPLAATEDGRSASDRGISLTFQDRLNLPVSDPRNPNHRTYVAPKAGGGSRSKAATGYDEQQPQLQRAIRDAVQQVAEAQRELEEQNHRTAESYADLFMAAIDGAGSLNDELKSLASQLAKTFLTRGFEQLLNGSNGASGGLLGGSIIPGILHSGGVAGSAGYGHGRAVSPAMFAGAPRYHSGGVAGLRPGEIPAILQRGEVVIPKLGGRAAAVSGPASVTQNINVVGATGNQEVRQMVAAGVAQGNAQIRREVPGLVENHNKRWR